MRNASILSLWVACATACTTVAEPKPPLVVTMRYAERGGVMAPGIATIKVSPRRLSVQLVESALIEHGTPVGTLAEAILADRGRPFRAGSKLLRGLTLAPYGDLVASGRSSATAGLLSSQFVTRISAPGSGLPDIMVVLKGSELRLGLRTPDDQVDVGGAQLALLRPLSPDADGVLMLQWREPGSSSAIAVTLRIGAIASADELACVQAKLAAATKPPPAPTNPASRPTDLAREAVGARPRRSALLAIAASHKLNRCLDLLLSVEEPQLIAIAEQLPLEPTTAWDIERAFCTALLPALQRGELVATVSVCLRRHFGALALDPTALEFALQASCTIEQFDAALLSDNLRALDARHARRRTAAFSWLTAQDHPIADYDPLAPRAERKAAIRRHRQSHRR